MVKHITSEVEFHEVLASAGNKLVVVDFTATWCETRIAPVFTELSDQHEGQVVFIKVDVNELADVAQECGIQNIPTFQFYKNGKMVHEFSGFDPDMLQQKVVELM